MFGPKIRFCCRRKRGNGLEDIDMNTKTTFTALMLSLLLVGPALAAKDSDGPARQPQISRQSNQDPTITQLPDSNLRYHENNH